MDAARRSQQMVALWFSLVPSFNGSTDDCVSSWSLTANKVISKCPESNSQSVGLLVSQSVG